MHESLSKRKIEEDRVIKKDGFPEGKTIFFNNLIKSTGFRFCLLSRYVQGFSQNTIEK